jgi:type IV secretory pathway VirB6-like protein
MRVFGWICLVVGVVALLFSGALLLNNNDLATGGPALLPSIVTDSWRLLLGPAVWIGALGLTTAWLAIRRLPGLAWLSLLVFAVTLPLYLAISLVAVVALAWIAIVIGGILAPVGICAIASAIGRAVARRRSAQPRPLV